MKEQTFWSLVIDYGLPIAMALTEPDAQGQHGPLSGTQLAETLRLLVAQLIEFQMQHGLLPGHLQLRRHDEMAPGRVSQLRAGTRGVERCARCTLNGGLCGDGRGP